MKIPLSIQYFLSAVVWEFKHQLKSLQIILVLFFYGIYLAVLYYYSLKSEIFLEKKNYWGLLFLSVFFMVILMTGKSLQREKEAGAYKIQLMSPMPRSIFYIAKIAIKALLIFLILMFYQLIYKILLVGQLEYEQNEMIFFLLLFPYILNLISIGELISLMSSGNRMRELVLPAIFFPVSVPVFIIYTSVLNKFVDDINIVYFIDYKILTLPLVVLLIYILTGIFIYTNLSVEEG
ncbi:MAG: ABC transporter permease [Leptospiraceae bacterium]|nr:ABC transporter permease [Leptospiraceae bacterium]MDW7976208.1 heme exporter protein CcmB [Leptospiraceae bacterium]